MSQSNTGAAMNRHRSKQDYATPPEFIVAVEKRFGPLEFDIAASPENRKAERYWTEADNALDQDWNNLGLAWLNPPFANIAAWAESCKAALSTNQQRTLLLVPASVGSNWFRDHVHRHALVLGVNGRLSFDGKDPYPKDLILCCYGFGVGFDVWDWRAT